MRPAPDAWVQTIAIARAARVPVIYTTPVSRSDSADVVMLPTDLSAETGAAAAHAYSLDKAMKMHARASVTSTRSRRCRGSDGHHTIRDQVVCEVRQQSVQAGGPLSA
jgi:IS5 family transposase